MVWGTFEFKIHIKTKTDDKVSLIKCISTEVLKEFNQSCDKRPETHEITINTLIPLKLIIQKLKYKYKQTQLHDNVEEPCNHLMNLLL